MYLKLLSTRFMSVFSIDILKKIKDSHTEREWEAGDLINNKTGTNSGLRTFFLLYFFFKRLNHFCGQADLLIWPWSLFQHDLELTQEWPRYDLRKKPISAPMVALRMLGCPLANPIYWSKAPSVYTFLLWSDGQMHTTGEMRKACEDNG